MIVKIKRFLKTILLTEYRMGKYLKDYVKIVLTRIKISLYRETNWLMQNI